MEDSYAGLPGVATGRDNVRTAPLLLQRTDTPLQAVEEFLRDHPEFEIDRSRDRYILSHNYHGFLRRRADDSSGHGSHLAPARIGPEAGH